MGWREALAGAPPTSALGGSFAAPTRGAFLRRFGSYPGSHAGEGAPERHQPAPHQLLWLAEAWPQDRSPHEECREVLLRASAALQQAPRGEPGRQPGFRGPLLLPEPHRL